MATVTAYPAFMTVEEFATYPFPEGKVELVRGEARVMPPAGVPHATVESNLLRLLLPFVHESKLGRVFPDNLGYELIAFPHTVRNPDASFVRASRLPLGGATRGFFKLAPDLAVEVLSPSETAWELQEKVDDYLAAGTQQIWVIDPKRRTVTIVSAEAAVRSLGSHEMLDGGDLVPGFQMRVAELFEGTA